MAFTKVTASTWCATFSKGKQVYTIVVHLTIIYGSTIQHLPKDTKIKRLEPAAKLFSLQNKCLKSITEAYKATNTKVLEAESGVIPLDIYLDQITLTSRDKFRCNNNIKLKKIKVCKKLASRRGKKCQLDTIPSKIINIQTRATIEKTRKAMQVLQEES